MSAPEALDPGPGDENSDDWAADPFGFQWILAASLAGAIDRAAETYEAVQTVLADFGRRLVAWWEEVAPKVGAACTAFLEAAAAAEESKEDPRP